MKLGKPPKTLRQRLTDFVTSKDYDKYSDPMKGFDITSQGGKVIEIQKILLIYRKQALKELRKDKTIVNEDGFSLNKVFTTNKKVNSVIKNNRADEYLNLK
mgnify:CR=1 FL=1